MSDKPPLYWPPDYTREFTERWNNGDSIEADTKLWGITLATGGRYGRKGRAPGTRRIHKIAESIVIPEPLSPIYQAEPIQTPSAIVISDLEIPDHDPFYLRCAILAGMANHIRTLIIAGDFVANDHFSPFPKRYQPENAPNEKQILATAQTIINQLAIWFTQIVLIAGNHDERIAKTTNAGIDLGMLLKHPNFHYSRYSYLWLTTPFGDVRILHTKQYRKNPLSLAQDILDKSPRKGHIVIAHPHIYAQGYSRDGRYQMHCLGTGRDPNRTAYLQLDETTHPTWNSSFLKIADGELIPLFTRDTNWRRELGALYPALHKSEKGKQP